MIRAMSAFAGSGNEDGIAKGRDVPKAAVSTCSKTAALFDQLVGEQLDRVGHPDAESLGRLQVDDELELGRLHHR